VEKNITLSNSLEETRKMIKKYDYKTAEIILNSIEKMLIVISEIGYSIDTYLNNLRSLVNYYNKMDKEYFYKNIINDLLYIGENIFEENEKEINIYISDLSENLYGNQERRKKRIKELEKKELDFKYKVDSYIRRAALKASLGALILCSGIQYGPKYANSKANCHYALEKDIDTGEEKIIEISSNEYHGKKYVREYCDYKLDSSTLEYYREVVDYLYSDEKNINDKKIDITTEIKYSENLKEIVNKLDENLEIYDVHVVSTNKNIKDIKGKIVLGKQYEEYDADKYTKLLLLIKIFSYSSFILGLASSGIELAKCGKYISIKDKLKTAIEEYDYYVYHDELNEAEELELAKSIFKR